MSSTSEGYIILWHLSRSASTLKATIAITKQLMYSVPKLFKEKRAPSPVNVYLEEDPDFDYTVDPLVLPRIERNGEGVWIQSLDFQWIESFLSAPWCSKMDLYDQYDHVNLFEDAIINPLDLCALVFSFRKRPYSDQTIWKPVRAR